MTIAQALKEKNKKVAKIQKIWDKIQLYNSVQEGEERPYSSSELYDQVHIEISELISLKTRIHAASQPVRESIFTLSELKNQVQRVRSINTTNGSHRDRYSGSATTMIAELSIQWKDQTVELLEEEIEKIQEKLDQFNHTTQI